MYKRLITLEPHGIFDQVLHTIACQPYLTTNIFKSFLVDEGLLSIISVGCGQLVKCT